MKMIDEQIFKAKADVILFPGCSEIDGNSGAARVDNYITDQIHGIDVHFGSVLMQWFNKQRGNAGKPMSEYQPTFYGIIMALVPTTKGKPAIGFFQNRMRFNDAPNDSIIIASMSSLARYYFHAPDKVIAMVHPGLDTSHLSMSYELLPDNVMFYIGR